MPVAEPTGSAARPTRRNPKAAWLLGTGLLSVAVSLAVRAGERGPYVSGWALVAPAQGAARQRAIVACLRARQDGGRRVPGRHRPFPRRPALHPRRLARRGPATDGRSSPRPSDAVHQPVRVSASDPVAGVP